jgi:hypothetical protein
MDLIESLAISEGLTQLLKYATNRERPDGSGRNSFPSGHAADTFAFATALERHLGWKGAVPAYILASYVAISRLPANRHWLSDAVFGASVWTVHEFRRGTLFCSVRNQPGARQFTVTPCGPQSSARLMVNCFTPPRL